MEHRHDVQERVVLGDPERVGHGLGEAVEEHRAVRVDDALGVARRAGRVTHARGVGLVERGPAAERRGRGQQRLVLGERRGHPRLGRVAHDHDRPHARDPVADPLEDRPEARVGEDDRVGGVVDDEGQVLRRQAQVERVEHGARAGRRPVELEVAVAVPGERRHTVALLHAELGEHAREAQRPLGEVGVGVAEQGLAGHARGEPLLRPEAAAALEEMGERQRVMHHEVVDVGAHRPEASPCPRL